MDYRAIGKRMRTNFLVRDRMEEDRFVAFLPNRPQLRFLGHCQKLSEQRRRQRHIVVKSRRIGLSRVTNAIGVCFAAAYPHFQARVMAHYDDTAIEQMQAMALMASRLPFPYRPQFEPAREYERVVIPHANGASVISRTTAKAPGKGRGRGFSFIHFTEAAHYPINAPFTALLPTVPKSIDRSFVMIESTANGRTDEGQAFYEYWQNASEIDDRADSEFVRFFVPYTEDPYAVADPALAKDAPIDDEERILLRAGVERAQIAWRRIEIATQYRGIVEDFNQENPISPDEAFVTSNSPAFNADERQYVRSTIRAPLAVGRFEQGKFIPSPNDSWQIWKFRADSHEYYVGIDAARGVDEFRPERPPGDYAAIVVFDGTTGEQVARLQDRLNPQRLAKEVNEIGRYYATPQYGARHFALLNIEITGNLGLECQRRVLDEYGYPIQRFARWKGRDDRITRRPTTSIGWETNNRSRDLAFAAFRGAIADRQVIIYDRETVNQIAGADLLESGWEVRRGHDDILLAALIGWMARKQYPPRVVSAPDDGPQEAHEFIVPAMVEMTQALIDDWNQLGIDARGRVHLQRPVSERLVNMYPERNAITGY